MRSDHPMSGNPWPHDMVITIEDGPYPLIDLLFIRSAWGIELPWVPPVDPEPEVAPIVPLPAHDAEVLGELWWDEWTRGWARYDAPQAPSAPLLNATEASEDELTLEALYLQPSVFWYAAADLEALGSWKASLTDKHDLPLEQTPERRVLPALIGAWRDGVDTIVQLPYGEPYAERINERHLVVSRVTRMDPTAYARALLDAA
jgi:hypothetical protein